MYKFCKIVGKVKMTKKVIRKFGGYTRNFFLKKAIGKVCH